MLDLRYVLDHLDEVRTALLRRSPALAEPLNRITELGAERKRAILELEKVQRERNAASEAMAKIADKKSAEFAQMREAAKVFGAQLKELEAREKAAQEQVEELLLSLPNMPFESIPDGHTEADNRLVRTWGEKPAYDFAVKDHVDVALQAERAAPVAAHGRQRHSEPAARFGDRALEVPGPRGPIAPHQRHRREMLLAGGH